MEEVDDAQIVRAHSVEIAPNDRVWFLRHSHRPTNAAQRNGLQLQQTALTVSAMPQSPVARMLPNSGTPSCLLPSGERNVAMGPLLLGTEPPCKNPPT